MNELREKLNVFPWADAPRLCPLLSEAELWADIFSGTRFRRKAVARAARAIHLQANFTTADAQQVTRCLLRVLATRRGRKALNDALGGQQIPQEVAQRLMENYVDDLCALPDLEITIEDGTPQYDTRLCRGIKIFARPSEFGEWLRAHEWKLDQKRWIALYTCIMAMAHPTPNTEYGEELLAFDSSFARWIAADATSETNPEATPAAVEEAGDNQGREEIVAALEPLPATEEPDDSRIDDSTAEPMSADVPVVEITPPLAPVPANIDASGVVTTVELRARCREFEREVKRMRRELVVIEESVQRVQELEHTLAQIPLLERRPLLPDNWAAEIEGRNIGEATTQLLTWEQLLGEVSQLADQASALLDRTGLSISDFKVLRPTDLVSAQNDLRAVIAELQSAMEMRSQEAAEAELLLSAIEAAGDAGDARLLEGIDPARWARIFALIARTDPGSLDQPLAGAWDIAGIAVAWACKRDEKSGLDLTAKLLCHALHQDGREALLTALAFLTPGQMQQLAEILPEIAPVLCELLLAAAAEYDRGELLDYIDPLLKVPTQHPTCIEYYQAVVAAHWRGELVSLTQQLAVAQTGSPRMSVSEIDQRFRRDLHERIARPPGMEGTYKRLRVIARNQFFKPLEGEIDRSTPNDLLRHWKSFGSLEDMVEECRRAIPKTEKVGDTHRHQTHRYLQDFQDALEGWNLEADNARATASALPTVRAAWERIATDPAPACRTLHATMRAVQQARDIAALAKSIPESNFQSAEIEVLKTAVSTQLDTIACSSTKRAECQNRLEQLAGEAKDGTKSSAEFYQGLTEIIEATQSALPARDFLARTTSDGMVRIDFMGGPALVDPCMTHAWPVAVIREEVPLEVLLHDAIRARTKSGLPTIGAAVDGYLQRSQFGVAQRAAESIGDESLTIRTRAEAKRQRDEFRRAHAATLDEAKSAASNDGDIRDSLLELERALDEPNLVSSREWIAFLNDAILAWRERQDPEIDTLKAFIQEGGKPAQVGSLSELRQAVEQLRLDRRAQREHIFALQEAAQRKDWPAFLCESWRTLAESLDRPAWWFPHSDDSELLAEAVRTFLKYLDGKWRWRSSDADFVVALMQGFAEWVPAQIQGLLSGSRNSEDPAFQRIFALEKDLQDGCPDRHVLSVLGHLQPKETALARIVTTETQTSEPHLSLGSRDERPKSVGRTTVGWSDLRDKIRQAWEADLRMGNAGQRDIQESVRMDAWEDVAAKAAAYLRLHREILPAAACSDVEAIFAVARALSGAEVGTQELLEEALLAMHGTDCGYYLKDRLAKLTAEFILRLAGYPVPEAVGKKKEVLREILQHLRELSLLDLRQHPLGRLISRSSTLPGPLDRPVSAWLARVLWTFFEGEKSYAHLARGELLLVLFRLALHTEIETLAEEFGEERRHLVVNCVRAFAHAEAHPEAQAQALHLGYALQAGGGLRPWNHLVSLLRLPSERSEPPSCELASPFVEYANDRELIEVRVRPSLDPLESLVLHLGNEAPAAVELMPQGETLYGERVFAVRLPPVFGQRREDPLRIPWRLTGKSSRDQKSVIEVRGAWTLTRPERTAAALPEPFDHYWPGAKRTPVARSSGLHGRTREFDQIRRAIFSAGRQSSIMVSGQRRIGKTSVLREMAKEMSPRQRGMCGAFVDIAALTLPSDAARMAESFFQFVVAGLDSAENDPIPACLRKVSGPDATVAALAVGLKPQHNLLDAFERLVQRLSEASGGEIERLVIFIDEFDRFVEPMLMGLAGEVRTFMWNLRSVVQRAQTVSLVLAGSGLQRLLTDDSKEALFGSITQISIDAFTWESDHKAVLDTLLPEEIRFQLCRRDELETVAEHGWKICGGHPMFLALLGAAAAALGHGRHWTPAFLNYVVEQVVENGINAEGVQVERSLFYGHVFESLQRLPQRDQALAKLLFVHLAEHTTTDFPWLETQRALTPLSLPPSIKMEDCESVLKTLSKEQAVTQESGRVRVTVPITAAALRRGAPELQREALVSLGSTRG